MGRQFCTFYLADLFMGIEVEKVQEILRFDGVTPVPLAPEPVSGLINLRGQIVTAIDLRRRVAVRDSEIAAQPMNIILSAAGGSLSFVVDRVGDVVEVEDADFEQPPDTLKGRARQLIRGAYKLERNLLLILDVDHAAKLGDQDEVAVTSKETL